ncbi:MULTISPECIES: hypothetical protein [Streptomyces]|uniref:hypothetical protein n=1 Tax=Streptomyces TaxID=1883 RepID=UPI0021F8C48D|nr:hypothetical protein [Streptomyces sp. RS2]MCW1095714.1 hypothetical protein [Streptomyces sp. RS2]
MTGNVHRLGLAVMGDAAGRLPDCAETDGHEVGMSGFDFVEIGEQWDEEDGLELVLEVLVRQVPTA